MAKDFSDLVVLSKKNEWNERKKQEAFWLPFVIPKYQDISWIAQQTVESYAQLGTMGWKTQIC